MASVEFDFLVLGSGLAGLSFALEAAKFGSVGVLTKAQAEESNTGYAQGGIAAAVGEADSWELHERDTMIAGAGLNDERAVRFLVQQAPAAIEWLRRLGARFDVHPENDSLRLGREGGHSRSRIVHHADNTGWEIERAVVEAVRAMPNITVYEHTFATELLVADGRCVGAAGMVSGIGLRVFLGRKAVLLATGGCGKIYSHTTNPRVATGDGYALARRIGAELRNMEFMQFHPTTLYHPQMRSFLISEAVRGAGATLRNHHGRRFMYDYDERLELAPRDVVARAIDAEMKRLQTWCVYLDTTHLKRELLEERFPTIYNALKKVDIEIHKDWIPVVPAQHYSCGGVVTDLDGRTTVRGLYAAGEVACTGVHGGNRLASNSLLEALVFGRAAAFAAAEDEPYRGPAPDPSPVRCVPEAQAVRIRHGVQRTMTDHAGIVRSNAGLAQALERIEALQADYERQPSAEFSVYAAETPNILDTALEVVRAAISRKENVGLHYNKDLVNGGGR